MSSYYSQSYLDPLYYSKYYVRRIPHPPHYNMHITNNNLPTFVQIEVSPNNETNITKIDRNTKEFIKMGYCFVDNTYS